LAAGATAKKKAEKPKSWHESQRYREEGRETQDAGLKARRYGEEKRRRL
jgi:hypothetical protein